MALIFQRDCRYGEVCNGHQRCEAESSLSNQENLGIDLLKEAVSRSMRIKKRSVRLRNKVRYIFCHDFFKNYYLQFRRPPLVCWLFWSKLFFRGENSTSSGLFIKLPTHKISHKPWRWDFSNVDGEMWKYTNLNLWKLGGVQDFCLSLRTAPSPGSRRIINFVHSHCLAGHQLGFYILWQKI